MTVSEETIAEVLRLLPNHSTIEGLRDTDALKDVPSADIHAALHILEGRGLVRAGELFGRDIPLRAAKATRRIE
jgi:hypothetical protein